MTGNTEWTNFPTTKHSLQKVNAGGGDAFVTKFECGRHRAGLFDLSGRQRTRRGLLASPWTPPATPTSTGMTTSTDFPTSHAAQASYGGGESDAFVTELNAAGTALVYSTYLGGSGSESPMWHDHDLVSVALSTDASGRTFAYVAGGTGSTNFPTTRGPTRGFSEAVGETRTASSLTPSSTKYGPAGAVVYSSYFGGSMNDIAAGIAADSAGNAYLTGIPLQESANDPGGLSGCWDGLRRLCDEDQSRRLWARLLDLPWGTGRDSTIAVGCVGQRLRHGRYGCDQLPDDTRGVSIGLRGGGQKVFLTKLNATGTALLYSTYLGGSGLEDGLGIAVDGSGNAYVTGVTGSTDFPTRKAFQPLSGGPDDGFVAELNPSLFGGASLVYSSYLGGSGLDYGTASPWTVPVTPTSPESQHRPTFPRRIPSRT